MSQGPEIGVVVGERRAEIEAAGRHRTKQMDRQRAEDQRLADERRGVLNMASQVLGLLQGQNIPTDTNLRESRRIQPQPRRSLMNVIKRNHPVVDPGEVTRSGWILPNFDAGEAYFRHGREHTYRPIGPLYPGIKLSVSDCTVLTDAGDVVDLVIEQEDRDVYAYPSVGGDLSYLEMSPLEELFTLDDCVAADKAEGVFMPRAYDIGPMGRVDSVEARWNVGVENRVVEIGLADLCVKYNLQLPVIE